MAALSMHDVDLRKIKATYGKFESFSTVKLEISSNGFRNKDSLDTVTLFSNKDNRLAVRIANAINRVVMEANDETV